eukprot:scaffold240754_cov38-Prasinocladus_malaysianus.AAC.1
MHVLPFSKHKCTGVERKPAIEREGFAAGRLPQAETHWEPLAATATDSVTLEIAMEETAQIIVGKDGRTYKRYNGFDETVD